MVNRLAVLGMVVDPSGAIRGSRRAHSAIAGVGRTAASVKNRIFSLQGALAALGGGVVVRSFLKTATSMENLKIQLKTVTGSVNEADKAFARLTDFTTRTPYEIDQVVSAFTKLKAFGLDPSEEAMTAFGNTAAAMGKDLNQMIEAVADAATGEFERLKEFGIKSKQQGDQVSFTFQGITTTIKKESEAIQGYLMDIGNNQFGGAMADQMDTMSGAISNLKGDWTLFQDQLMNAGPFKLVKGLLNEVSSALFGDEKSVSSNAKAAGEAITAFLRNTILGTARFMDSVSGGIKFVAGQLSGMWDMYRSLPSFVQQVGLVGAFIGGPKIKMILLGVVLALTKIKALLSSDQSLESLTKQAEALRGVLKMWESDKAMGFRIDEKSIAQSVARLSMLEALIKKVKADAGDFGTGGAGVKAAIANLGGGTVDGPAFGAIEIPDTGSFEAAMQTMLNNIDKAEIKKHDEKRARVRAGEFADSNVRIGMAMSTMGEISAMHQKSQEEMAHITSVFEERNSELHSAAMARKGEAFNVFKQSFLTGYQEMADAAIPVMEQIGTKMAEIFGPGGTFARGIGDATASMLMFGKSGKDSMRELAQTIVHQVISAFVAMGVQQAVNFAMGKMFGATGTALSVTQAGITAAAWAPAAAAVSLASFGTNSVPAITGMASAYATSAGLSLASFEGGGFTGGGPRSGGVDGKGGFPAVLHPNETVTDHTKGQNGGGGTTNITFSINAINTSDATRLIMSQRGTIIGVINQAVNERGRPALI
jgi:hypothetical protein